MVSYSPPPPDHEPHRVLIGRGVLVDSARDGRAVPYKIYYPVAHGLARLPVVVWSHGLGGSADGAAFLGRFIASHGYVVIHVTHFGTDTSLWEGKPGHPWDVIRAARISRDVIWERYRDIPFLLDSLPEIARLHPEIAPHMDGTTLGISGHSLGALTVQIMAGQGLDAGWPAPALREPRFRAAIAFSPIPGWEETPDDFARYRGIAIPMLHMTGTQDVSPLDGQGYEPRLDVFEGAGGPGQHLVVLNDADHMVFSGSRGQLGGYAKMGAHKDMIKLVTLAFWDAYLKDDPAARDWLTGGGLAAWLGAEGRAVYRG